MSVVVRCLKDRLQLHRDGKGMIEREKVEGGMLLPGWNAFAALVCSFFLTEIVEGSLGVLAFVFCKEMVDGRLHVRGFSLV